MNRRGFLGGVGALMAVAAAPGLAQALERPIEILWGDGWHDDAAGLNALLAGMPVRRPGGSVYRTGDAGVFRIPAGRYIVGQPVAFASSVSNAEIQARDVVVVPAPAFPDGGTVLTVEMPNPTVTGLQIRNWHRIQNMTGMHLRVGHGHDIGLWGMYMDGGNAPGCTAVRISYA